MRPDSHSGGSYIVNNLYLDDRYDSLYYAKILSQNERDKYRLRHYNDDLSFIRLERKHKNGLVSYKDTMPISQEQYLAVKSGDLDFTLNESAPLWQTIAMLHRLKGLRPSAIYSYKREAYVFDAGDVRFTFDHPPFTTGENAGTGPIYQNPLAYNYGDEEYRLMLEVKYTGFLPVVLRQILNGLPLAHTGISKYCIVRERGILPYGKI